MSLRFKKIMLVICFILFTASVVVAADYDYKELIPVLPDSINEMSKTGEPDGANMETSGQHWSVVNQRYGDGSNHINFFVVVGSSAPEIQKFQSLQQLNVETEESITRTLEISGKKALLNIKKDSSRGTLAIAVQDNALAVLETSYVENEEELLSLADDITIEKIENAFK